jgi:hypothetical protein
MALGGSATAATAMEWALANLFSHLMFTIILTVFKTQNVSFKLKTKKKKEQWEFLQAKHYQQ